MSNSGGLVRAGLRTASCVSPSGDKITGWYVREIRVMQVSGRVRRNEDGEIELVEDENGEVFDCSCERQVVEKNGEIIFMDANEQEWAASHVTLLSSRAREEGHC
jgi:hypothetical protein